MTTLHYHCLPRSKEHQYSTWLERAFAWLVESMRHTNDTQSFVRSDLKDQPYLSSPGVPSLTGVLSIAKRALLRQATSDDQCL